MEMKHFKYFAKMFLYLFIGGLLAFIVCGLGLYFNAQQTANDIARNYIQQVCADGCSNYDTRVSYYDGIIKAYSSKYIVIPGSIDDITMPYFETNVNDQDYVAVNDGQYADSYGENASNLVPSGEHLNSASMECLKVYETSNSDNELNNSQNNDYVNKVQRGTPITVEVTVNLRMFLPFRWVMREDGTTEKSTDGYDNNEFIKTFINGEVTFPVTAKMTGISTKFFKGIE